MSLAVLILGIASIVCGGSGIPGLVCAIIALVLSKKAVAKDGINTQNKVGKILAIIGLILSILGLVSCIACTALGAIGTAAGITDMGYYY